MPFDAEVIVAGAGPAGAVAARTLAAAGVDTLLLDRASFPRNKPCGGGISGRATRRFPWLTAALAGIDVHRVTTLHVESPDGSAVDMTSPDPSVLLVRRVEFDHALVEDATRGAGARLDERFEVTQVQADAHGVTLKARDGRERSAPFVVAADGVHSVIAKRLGVNARWPRHAVAIDMMEETPVETLRADRPDVLWVAYAYKGFEGYAYVFPKTHHVNVGIGCLLSQFTPESSGTPYALQEGFVSALVRAGILHGRSERRHFTPFLIPVGGPLRRCAQGRVLFAGDAGGFVNAFTAEGIYYAMISGELAGRAIAHGRHRGSTPGVVYERSWRKEIGAELGEAVLIQRYLLSRPDRVNRIIRGGATLPWLAGMILDYTRGDLSYPALRRRMCWRFPMTVFRIARERIGARLTRATSEG